MCSFAWPCSAAAACDMAVCNCMLMSKLHAADEYSSCTGDKYLMQDCMFMRPKSTSKRHVECCGRMHQSFEPLCADEEVQRAKGQFVGAILQQPPMYSAVSIKGERLYKAARRGGFSVRLGQVVSVSDHADQGNNPPAVSSQHPMVPAEVGSQAL